MLSVFNVKQKLKRNKYIAYSLISFAAVVILWVWAFLSVFLKIFICGDNPGKELNEQTDLIVNISVLMASVATYLLTVFMIIVTIRRFKDSVNLKKTYYMLCVAGIVITGLFIPVLFLVLVIALFFLPSVDENENV